MADNSKVSKTIIKEWIKELRSGRHQQCMRKLTDGVANCCLGVLCKTNGLVMSMEVANGACRYFYHFHSTVESNLLPEAFRNCVGLSNNQQRDLSTMNDNGLGFDAIADYLELRYILDVSTGEWAEKNKYTIGLVGELDDQS
jgi:hypothetical protein